MCYHLGYSAAIYTGCYRVHKRILLAALRSEVHVFSGTKSSIE